MNIINDFFDKVFCITCFGDIDRQESCSSQFKKYNIDFQWVVSVDNSFLINNGKISTGELSLYLSHLHCFKLAKMNNYKRFCIFEDDFVLFEDWEQRFGLFIKDLPENWDILYMGEPEWIKYVFPTQEEFFKENCSICNYGSTSHFMGFNESVYEKCLCYKPDFPIDVLYNQFMLGKTTYMPSKKRLADAISIPHEKHHSKILNFDLSKYIPSKLRSTAVDP